MPLGTLHTACCIDVRGAGVAVGAAAGAVVANALAAWVAVVQAAQLAALASLHVQWTPHMNGSYRQHFLTCQCIHRAASCPNVNLFSFHSVSLLYHSYH